MPTHYLIKLLRVSLLFLLVQFGVVSLARAQNPITLEGRVLFSTGQPATGATVTMKKTFYDVSPPVISTETTVTDGGGNYSFASQGRCAVSYKIQAVSPEIVDDEPLPPSGTGGPSGCVLSNFVVNPVIARPAPITLGGYVRDQTNRLVQGLTVTMTRTKYDLTPNVVTTATTTTDGSGHYQFSTFSRCSVVEAFKASLNESVFQGGISISGCVKSSNDHLSFPIDMGSNLQDAGKTTCNSNIPRPVNVTNGNMYLQQTDYQLPGAGEAIAITRTYNSISTNIGLFGRGWTTAYDETVTTDANNRLQLTMPDGRLVTFATPDFFGQMVKNGDGTYTVTFKDGGVHQFNSSGKLLSQTDLQGNQTTLAYNPSGNLISVTDPFGRTLSITTNASGRVLSISDTMGTIASYTYGASNQLISVTYADNSSFQFSYDGSLRLTSVSDALGNVVESHTYDSQGRATTSETHGGVERYTLNYVSLSETDVTNALGHVTKYFYGNIRGRRVVTRVEGSCSCGNAQIQTWVYDNQLNVTSRTDALTHTTSYTYDTSGNMLTQTDATGTITYTYNSLGEVLTRTDQMNGVTTNTYNAQGNLLTTNDALNNTTSFTYDSRGQLLTVTDARNNATTFTYDTNGNFTRRTDALNKQTNIAYNARGRITSVTNALTQTTNYEYDLAGRLKKIIYPDTNFVLFTYDLAGRRTKIKDPRGYETTFAYDPAYRLSSETNADAKVTSYSYDLMSNLTGVTDALNRTTNYTEDEFNRLTKIKYPEAAVGAGRLEENFTYDSAGNLLQKTNQATLITSFCYDNANRLTTTTDPALKVTSYEYNARSQQTAVVDAIDQRYEFVYDALGRRTQEKKGTATMSFVYDAAGNRSQRTDYNNAVTDYTSDALNRLTTISYPDLTAATYGYDELSRLTTATNPTGTVTIAYDNRSRVSSVSDVFGQVVSYAYDASSNRTQLSLNAATSATYQYDVLNRLTQLADSGALNTTFAYDPTNKLTSRSLPNGVTTSYQYDDLDRLTQLTHAKGANTLADFQYQFNVVNNITQMTDGAGANNYTYDPLDRLTAATHPNQTNESYSFDDVGNRTASHEGSSYTYQAFNRLIAANGASFGYDANGNLTSKTDATGSWTYSWDYENRLKQASQASGVMVTYAYDALGRRTQRTSSAGSTTKFVYDGSDVIRDLDASDGAIADYLNGLGVDNKLRQTAGGAIYYFAPDHLGTTRALTDASGNLSSNLNYDSFGNISSGSASTRYTYTGREIDSDTGLMYYRARWHDPQQGRFASEDPIGLSGGLNLFAYVNNQPIRFRDPEGLRPLISPDDFSDPYRGERSLFDPNYKSPLDRFIERHVDPYFQPFFGGGGLFRREVFVEFISANERSRQPCKKFGERFFQSFTETNAAVPGLAAPSGAGLAPSRKAAEFVGEPTLYQWADNWFAPPNGISNGPFLKGTIARGALTSLAVSAAWEGGVATGSFIDAAGCPCGY